MNMNLNGGQRKRGGRLAKNANANENSSSQNDNIENSEGAISPTLNQSESAKNAPASECRRSSRKKIIKFDVRDLLNKNRKTHKIQIEARIDSNAPSTSKAALVGGAAVANLKTATSREDLLSKHKTFLEKSAIFRRYSISQEQKPPPLPIPPLLSKSSESKDSSFCGTSSSQEFLSHALIKPKEPTSLIVAQIESNKPISANLTKRKSLNKSPQIERIAVSNSEISPIVQQKKRGRPAKNKIQTFEEIIQVQADNSITNITAEKAKNWKEYKACLAQTSSSGNDEKQTLKEKSALKITQQRNDTHTLNAFMQSDIPRSDDDGSFSGFQISKDELSCDSPVLEKISPENVLNKTEPNENICKDKIASKETPTSHKARQNKDYPNNDKKRAFTEEEIFQAVTEMSYKEDFKFDNVLIEESDQNKSKVASVAKNVKEEEVVKGNNNSAVEKNSKQDGSDLIKNITNIQTVSDECMQEEKAFTVIPIVDKFIKTSNEQEMEKSQCDDQNKLEVEIPCEESKCTITTIDAQHLKSPQIVETIETIDLKNSEISSKLEDKLDSKMEKSNILEYANQTLSQSPILSYENKSFSRTSSSSESENASDLSSYLSEPFSTTSSSSSRSYKSGDKVKISIKRISLPKSPSTSSQTSTSEELNNADIIKRKPPISKRSKRFLKKLDDSLNMENTTGNIDDCLQKTPTDLKTGDDFLATELSVEKNQSENFANLLSESYTKLASPKSCTQVGKELTTKEATMNSDECSLFSETKDPNSSESSNVNSLPDMDKNFKRTSLRNKKDNFSCFKKGEDVEKTKFEETQKSLVKKIAEKKQHPAQELNKNNIYIEHFQKTLVTDDSPEREKSSASAQSDKPEDNKHRRNIRKSQPNRRELEEPTTSARKQIYNTEEKSELSASKVETKILANDLVNATDLRNEKNVIKILNEEKSGNINKAFLPKDQTITEAKIGSIDSNLLHIQTDFNVVENQAKLSEQPSPKSIAFQKVQTHSKADGEQENQNKTMSGDGKPMETVSGKHRTPSKEKTNKINIDLETSDKTESTKKDLHNKSVSNITKSKKEQFAAKQLKNIHEEICSTKTTYSKKEADISISIKELTKVKVVEKVRRSTKSPTQKLTRSKAETEKDIKLNVVNVKENNKEDLALKIQTGIEEKEKLFLTSEKGVNKNSNCEMEQNNDEILIHPEKDVRANKTEEAGNIPKQKQQMLEENYESLKYDELVLTSKIISLEVPAFAPAESKIKQIESDIILEKGDKIVSTESGKGKKAIHNKELNSKKECLPQSGKQQNLKKEQETALKVSHSREICLTGKPSSEEKKTKDDNIGKLLTVSSELREAETSIKELETETEGQCNKLDLETSKVISNKKKGLSNVISFTDVEENIEKIKSASSKTTSSKNTLHSPKIFESQNPSLTSLNTAETTKSSTDINLVVENSTTESSEALQDTQILKLSPETSSVISLTKTDSLKPLESSKQSSEVTLKDTLQVINEASEIENLIKCNSNTQPEISLHDSKDKLLTSSSVTKRRGRKPRFKNLHKTADSETDSSNGKITPIDEEKAENKSSLEKKLIDINITSSQKSSEIEIKKNNEDSNAGDGLVGGKEDANTNFSTSQIKNVSIETNTLLDILRTVQSNTAAALKARKSPTNIENTENEYLVERPCKVNIEESSKCSQDLLKIQQKETYSSIISNDVSTFMTQKLNLSPARSDSNSPLTLKKLTLSPTRSSSSSPLTLKKVTRRYERRSNRGDDSAHKTLEETFAEIAAQSSKAVLAAKEFEEKPLAELVLTNMAVFAEKDEVKEIVANVEKVSSTAENDLTADKDIKHDVLLDVEQDKDIEHDVLLDVAQDKDTEAVLPTEKCDDPIKNAIVGDLAKNNPTKRGRKPKNRNSEFSSVLKEEEISIDSKTESKDKEIHEQKQTDADVESKESNGGKNDSKKVKESSDISFNTNLSDYEGKMSSPVTTSVTEIRQPLLTEEAVKQMEDITENKPFKKSNKKRETKVASEEDNSFLTTIACQEKSDEALTPKQPIEKRDPSLNKSETKSGTKKLSKKAKSEEKDSSNLTQEEVKNTAASPSSSRRGRKPKNQQAETPQSSSKKITKKESYCKSEGEEINEEKEKLLFSECESLLNSSLDKSLDEKLAKKKRQKKLKEAFEAALTDFKEKNKDISTVDFQNPVRSLSFGVEHLANSPPPDRRVSFSSEDQNEIIKLTCLTPVETDEDPDPLKDIEKFIADGVNLLKKDYKLNEDSVDVDVIQTAHSKTTKVVEEPVNTSNDLKTIFNTFETPAATPINTPSVTPPPKSPSSLESSTPDEKSGVRRSHRIKLITKTPKALVGRGLVRDRERFSIKDDVETKTHYTLDDHLTDLAEVEAKNAKFLKEMEERLSNFQVIKENEYLCERVISREARKMICDCFLTHDEEDRGELGCGEDCLNRLLMIECGLECNVKERCTNKRFQKWLCSPCRVFRTEKKGFGIMADIEILPGEFIMEYVGEVIDTEEFEKRRIMYSQEKNRHYYFMALRSDAIIDATIKGNISRFINHSCDPNAETQKWTVNGELRIGFFSRKSIMPGEEITFNYQYQRYGREAQRCYCESSSCTGWIGQEPTSDEGEQMEDEDYETEDEEEEAGNSNLLVHDDDEDSDASVADPEEVQKQLEMAAAQAEVELAPLHLIHEKHKQAEQKSNLNKADNEEDSKSKFKKLLSKMAEKVAAKQKQNKREQKLQRKNKSKPSSAEMANKLRFLEDPDIEDEVRFLKECGLNNQSDTLRLSRLMVRAKLVQTRLNLLEILRKGDFPCRRLFLDYHGLRLLHGWMSEDAGNMQIRLSLLQTLETLPIPNKTVLTDSKVMQAVRTWSGPNSNLSPNEDSSSSNSNSQDVPIPGSSTLEESSEVVGLQKLASKLITTWEGLPEIFRIPKKERIEQMKEHEREADRQYAANADIQENTTATDRYRRDRFGRGLNAPNNTASASNRFIKPNPHKITSTPENLKNLSKAQRREMFAAKVARDEAEKRLAEERREFETKCRFFGLDPKKTRTQDLPFCVNPATGQWFSIERKTITTPPSYAHVQVPVKPKSTDPKDYQMPAVCSALPPQWKYAITAQGKIYYYHIKHRIPQWEPPSSAQQQQCELEAKEEESESEITTTAGEDSSDDDDDVLIGMDAAQLKAYIDRKVEMRRQKRYLRLVDERSISPRREEDRIYNQIEVRKYKENKEKIRKRKEDIRRKRAEALRQTSLNLCTLGSIADAIPSTSKPNIETDEESGALPIQDYLLSSDDDIDLKAEVNSPLIDKIVEGDKIVDELDALTTKRKLKRPLPPHRDLSEPSTSSLSVSALIATTLAAKQEYKKRKLEKKEKRKPKEQDAKYRKNKEKFRCEIAGIIVHHLKPYLKESCIVGRIQSNEDFNHLARKLTHFVMIKELKYCESVGQTLVVTESVKSKSREFIKKYMAKYVDVYVKPTNDPDFKDIPFTL